jgi:hypothetical protein
MQSAVQCEGCEVDCRIHIQKTSRQFITTLQTTRRGCIKDIKNFHMNTKAAKGYEQVD